VNRLGDVFWTTVARDLRGVAKEWWRENRDEVTELGEEEAREVFEDLKAGRVFDAKLSLAARMSADEWKAYRNKTTSNLEAVAKRRAALFEALGDLGTRAAEKIGNAALGAML